MAGRKEIITFKVDESLAAAMHGIPNRSAFIRAAILSALNGSCPLCKGTGILTPEQRQKWDRMADLSSVTDSDVQRVPQHVYATTAGPHESGLETGSTAQHQPQPQPTVSSENTEIGNKF